MRYADSGGLTMEGRSRREQVRLQAAEMFEHEADARQIASSLRVSTKSVYQWRRTWQSGGGAALASKGPGGNSCKLEEEQIAELRAALEAQRAYNFERGHTTRRFIPEETWDTLHEGLTAGERLECALRTMEKAYLDENRREYELTKHISLRLQLPEAYLQLRVTGHCQIDIGALAICHARDDGFIGRIEDFESFARLGVLPAAADQGLTRLTYKTFDGRAQRYHIDCSVH